MLPGETIASGAPSICECGHVFQLEVLRSGAGFYIGTTCRSVTGCEHAGEPYSREGLDYYDTPAIAQNELDTGQWRRR